MKQGFCARCFNYVDFCDCINYEYDLETTNDKVIPPPPEEKEPEVGTVWYTRFPVVQTALGLESAGADKFGMSLLLSMENMWTLEPPPGDPNLYLSVPVNRLPLNQTMDTMTAGSFYKYLQPWQLNYTNYKGLPIEDMKSWAAALMRCNAKKIGSKGCKFKETIKHFLGSFQVDEIPVPPDLTEKLKTINTFVEPEIVVGIIASFFPKEVLQLLNDQTHTAIDWDWIHRHLMATVDPDEGYRDKQQPGWEAVKDGDMLNTQGFYDFPSPSGSIAAGTSFTTSMYRTQKKPAKIYGYICRGTGVNKVCMPPKPGFKGFPPWITPALPWQFINGMFNHSAVAPVFDDIIPYDSEDDDLPTNSPFVNPLDKDTEPLANLPGTLQNFAGSPAVLRYPVMFQILSNPGSNQTQFLQYPCCEIIITSPTTIETNFVSQESPGFTLFCFISANSGGGLLANRNFRFTKISGPDTQIEISLSGVGPGVILTAVSNEILLTGVQFNNLAGGSQSLMYTKYYIKGVLTGPGTNTIWKVEQVGGAGQNGNFGANWTTAASLIPMSTVKLTPPVNGAFTNEGYLTQFQMTDGVIYEGKSITCNPRFQVPIMLQVRNEVNMVSYAPNSFVTPGTFGYVVGRSGGVGGLGSPYLPFDPVGVIVNTTYKLAIERSQGQIFVIGNLTYNL